LSVDCRRDTEHGTSCRVTNHVQLRCLSCVDGRLSTLICNWTSCSNLASAFRSAIEHATLHESPVDLGLARRTSRNWDQCKAAGHRRSTMHGLTPQVLRCPASGRRRSIRSHLARPLLPPMCCFASGFAGFACQMALVTRRMVSFKCVLLAGLTSLIRRVELSTCWFLLLRVGRLNR